MVDLSYSLGVPAGFLDFAAQVIGLAVFLGGCAYGGWYAVREAVRAGKGE